MERCRAVNPTKRRAGVAARLPRVAPTPDARWRNVRPPGSAPHTP
jgi:hypothetical protein